MTTSACNECSRTVETSADHYPYCSETCLITAAESRERRTGVPSTARPSPPKRAGRLTGF